MSPLNWLFWQSKRRDTVGELSRLLLGWAPSADLLFWGPQSILEAHELVEWALASFGLDTRENALRFASGTDRWLFEWRLALNGQPSHTPGAWRAVCS